MSTNKDFLLAVVHEFLLRKDRNLATVFKSKCNSVSYNRTRGSLKFIIG